MSRRYRTVCRRHHERICVFCGGRRGMAVHHVDLNHRNDTPDNLSFLCMNCHTVLHSQHPEAALIRQRVDECRAEYLEEKGLDIYVDLVYPEDGEIDDDTFDEANLEESPAAL